MNDRDLTAFGVLFALDTVGLFVATGAALSLAHGQLTPPLPVVVVPLALILAYIHTRRNVHGRFIAWYTGTETAEGDYRYA